MRLAEILEAIAELPPSDRHSLKVWMREQDRQKRKAQGQRALVSQASPLASAVVWTILSLVSFVLADAAVFRTGWYSQFLAPDSTAGQVELHRYWVASKKSANGSEVMVVGDSRVAEGFSGKRAQTVRENIRFWNMGIGGSSPRVWYYLIRDSDQSKRRFAAVIIALDHYSDADTIEDLGGLSRI